MEGERDIMLDKGLGGMAALLAPGVESYNTNTTLRPNFDEEAYQEDCFDS